MNERWPTFKRTGGRHAVRDVRVLGLEGGWPTGTRRADGVRDEDGTAHGRGPAASGSSSPERAQARHAMDRVFGLDLLRCIAVLMVLVSHTRFLLRPLFPSLQALSIFGFLGV